jgi:hypothetical protein
MRDAWPRSGGRVGERQKESGAPGDAALPLRMPLHAMYTMNAAQRRARFVT